MQQTYYPTVESVGDILVIAELERNARLVEVEGRPAGGPIVNAIRVEP